MRKQTNKRSSYKKRRGGVNSPSVRTTASKRPNSERLWAEQKEKIIADGKKFRTYLHNNPPLSIEQEWASEQNDRAILDGIKFPKGFSSWSRLKTVNAAIRESKK